MLEGGGRCLCRLSFQEWKTGRGRQEARVEWVEISQPWNCPRSLLTLLRGGPTARPR